MPLIDWIIKHFGYIWAGIATICATVYGYFQYQQMSEISRINADLLTRCQVLEEGQTTLANGVNALTGNLQAIEAQGQANRNDLARLITTTNTIETQGQAIRGNTVTLVATTNAIETQGRITHNNQTTILGSTAAIKNQGDATHQICIDIKAETTTANANTAKRMCHVQNSVRELNRQLFFSDGEAAPENRSASTSTAITPNGAQLV